MDLSGLPALFWAGGSLPELLAMVTRGPGNYLSWLKLVPVLLVYLLWVYTTQWVERDTRQLRQRIEFWHPVVFFPGLLGLALVWIIPLYIIALLVVVLCWAVPLGFYISDRNHLVPESHMVTFDSVVNAALAKIGIPRRVEEEHVEKEGPPVQFIGRDIGASPDAPDRAASVAEAGALVPSKELIYDALVRRATELVMEPKGGQIAVAYRIDGIMHAAESFERSSGEQVIEMLKILAGLNLAEKRKPQSGSFSGNIGKRQVHFRATSQGTLAGERFSLRIVDTSITVTSLLELGIRDKTAAQLQELINQPRGLILVAAPPGVGKTTSLFAILREMDRFTRNVMTFEDRIDYRVDNVTHIDYTKEPERPPPAQLRSVLRQEPDVLMLSDISDQEIAEMVSEAARDLLILSSIQANDAITGLFRLLEMGVNRALVADTLTAVWSQRLLRRLCERCKEPYKPKPEFLMKANLPVAKIDVFYRPPRNPEEVCPNCGGTGYIGRTGIFELLVVTDKIRDLLKANSSLSAVKAEARKGGMVYLQEDGLRQVIRGVTSVDELMRAFK